MEEKIAYLEAKTKTLESDLERANHNFSVSNQTATKLNQKLAEKEKEVEELKCRKEKLEKIVFDIGLWITEGNSICSELQKTRFAFKSAKIKSLRERLEKIFSEMTITTIKILHPGQLPSTSLLPPRPKSKPIEGFRKSLKGYHRHPIG